MMYSEFNQIMHELHRNYKDVSIRYYNDFIEPMYMNSNSAKREFCELLNIKVMANQDAARMMKLLETEIRSAAYQFNQFVITHRMFTINKVKLDWEVIEFLGESHKSDLNCYQLECLINRMLCKLFEMRGRENVNNYILEKSDGLISRVRVLDNGDSEVIVF